MKIIRCYATPENAVNAKSIIQDLLVAELEKILNTQNKDVDLSCNNRSSGSECA